jgi:hypothetical protein
MELFSVYPGDNNFLTNLIKNKYLIEEPSSKLQSPSGRGSTVRTFIRDLLRLKIDCGQLKR